jgi:predicted small lipoprotein YifL
MGKFMKNLILLFLLAITASACGVKNNLEKPNQQFPRTYPVK